MKKTLVSSKQRRDSEPSNTTIDAKMRTRRNSFPFVLKSNNLDVDTLQNILKGSGRCEKSLIFSDFEIKQIERFTSSEKKKRSYSGLTIEYFRKYKDGKRGSQFNQEEKEKWCLESNLNQSKHYHNYRGSRKNFRNFGSRRHNLSRNQKSNHNHKEGKSDQNSAKDSTINIQNMRIQNDPNLKGQGKRQFHRRHNHDSGQGQSRNCQQQNSASYSNNREHGYSEGYKRGYRGSRSSYRKRGLAKFDNKFNKDVLKEDIKNYSIVSFF